MILHNNNNNTYIYSAIIYYYYYYIMCLYEASTVLSIFNELTHLIVLTALWGRNSNFIDNNTGPDRLNNLIELIQVGSSEANTWTSQPGPRAQALNCHSLLPSACFPWKAEWRPGWAVRIFQCSKDPSCELTPPPHFLPPPSDLYSLFPLCYGESCSFLLRQLPTKTDPLLHSVWTQNMEKYWVPIFEVGIIIKAQMWLHIKKWWP